MKFKLLGTAIFAAAVAAFATPSSAFAEESYFYTAEAGAPAVGGYDPVSFFDDGEGEPGSTDFTTTYKGAEFRFASQANLDTFAADPEAYLPQYGGYCAWAVAQGQLAPGNPRHANVVNGKLYLNVNGQIERRWLRDTDGFIAKADTNWPGILGGKASTGGRQGS